MQATGANAFEVARAEGTIDEATLFAALASFHQLPFLASDDGWLGIEIESFELASCMKHLWLRLRDRQGRTFVVAAPSDPAARTLRHLGVNGALGHRVIDCIAPRTVVLSLIDRAFSATLTEHAVWKLAREAPEFSAHRRLVPWQAGAIAALVAAIGIGAWAAPAAAALALGALVAIAFLASAVFRLVLLIAAFGKRRPPPALSSGDRRQLPVYSVLVPLYREADIVDQTIGALVALDYPRSRLDIKLILEEDDADTLAALRRLDLPGCFEVVIVPPSFPRTKPKALNYALPRIRGDLVAVYDAEDVPRPDQLRRAAAAFARAPGRLACLQARLGIYNTNENWLTRQFTIEYATLFEVTLPALDQLDLPMMLGGTSNHFSGIR